MAERRMFAKSIIESDAFLEMPHSAQNLYIHLSMRADDDGFINNSKITMRTIGAKAKDLKMLEEKRFILNLGDVIVIKHWRINNKIRNDRKKDTLYPEMMHRLSVKANGAYTLTDEWQPNGNQMATKWQPNDNHATTNESLYGCIGKDRIVEDRIGEDNIYISNSDRGRPESYPQSVDKRMTDISNRVLGYE